MPLNELDHKFGGWFLRRGRGCFIPHMGPILGPTSKYFTSAGLETFHLLSLPWVLCKANSCWCCWKRGMVRGQALVPGRNTCHHHVQVHCFCGFLTKSGHHRFYMWNLHILRLKMYISHREERIHQVEKAEQLEGLEWSVFLELRSDNPRIIHCHTSTWDSMQIVHLLLYRGFAVCSIVEWCMLCCKLKGNAMQCSCLAWLQLFIVCDVRSTIWEVCSIQVGTWRLGVIALGENYPALNLEPIMPTVNLEVVFSCFFFQLAFSSHRSCEQLRRV